MHIESAAACRNNASRPLGETVQIAPGLVLPGFTMSFSRNEEIFGQEEAADFVYVVLSGAVRTVRLLADGRRQIGAFYLEGDVFGLERGELHRFSAEAVDASEIALIRRSVLESAAERDGAVARQLWALTSRDLERAEDHLVLLGRKTATEKVASFLLSLSVQRSSAQSVDLPMPRSDIADYLGLTIETVSRTLTHLERDRAIGLPSSRHVVLNARALAALDA